MPLFEPGQVRNTVVGAGAVDAVGCAVDVGGAQCC